MATDNSTSTNVSIAPSALRVAERYPLVAPVVVREFKGICPTLELIDFNSSGQWSGSCPTIRCHWILFSGAEAELLRSGLIDPSMIAVRPKRNVDSGHVSTKRLAGDRVEVRMDLDDRLDREHPLAPLAWWNWEALVEKAEGRPPCAPLCKDWETASLLTAPCPPELKAARVQAMVGLGMLSEAAHSLSPRVADEVFRRLQSVEVLMRKELERQAAEARPARPSYLRLVVSTAVQS